MNQHLWDGNMDYGWESLSEYCKSQSMQFSDKIMKCAEASCYEEIMKRITPQTLKRFTEIAEIFAEGLNDGYYFQYEDLQNENINGSRLKNWILLGSLTEVSLQVYLTIYLRDYEADKWQQWEDFDSDGVKKSIFSQIDDLKKKGMIDSTKSRSLKDAIRREIKLHTVPHPIERVMLDELIQFCHQHELFDEDDIQYLKIIQSNRNGIHAYMDRDIGSWVDLQYASRFWCYLLDYIMSCLPDIHDARDFM